MSNPTLNNSASSANGVARPRRALIVADAATATLQSHLAASGYETNTATATDAARLIDEFAPDILIIELSGVKTDEAGNTIGDDNELALARRLRAEAATYALPLIFAWNTDERTMRNAALNIGVDDYFPLAIPPTQMLARLDSLFWRIEAGRRAAPVVGDQRGEIDNFMLMLDSVREEITSGARGTLALVYAVSRDGKASIDKAARDRTLAEAHGFLKLNLRRIDAVAFYGPTTLFVYLPRMATRAAVAALTRLRGEFLNERLNSDIAIGLASFPEDGEDVETMIEKAEAAAEAARVSSTHTRVLAHTMPEQTRVAPTGESSLQGQIVLRQIPHAQSTQTPTTPAATPSPEQQPAFQREQTMTPPTAIPQPATHKLSSGVVRETRMADDVGAGIVMPVHSSHRMQANGVDVAHAAAEAAARERERRASGAVMPRRLLLTVSDAARMAQLNSLIRSAGYEARAAFDGQQALDLLRIERPDLLVLDHELHGIDGVETLRRLRQQGGGRLTLPVLLLLPSNNESVRSEALKLGARSVVTTPYDPADLLENVRVAGSVE